MRDCMASIPTHCPFKLKSVVRSLFFKFLLVVCQLLDGVIKVSVLYYKLVKHCHSMFYSYIYVSDMRVFYICQVTQSKLACDTRVNFRVEHASYISCVARDPSLCAAQFCKKHASNTLCAARESVFLCAAHKLTAIVYQRRIKAYNEMAH